MVLKADQERLKSLLKDTITLLCKNGLTFHSEFSIEAVIGITLDKDDILLVSINEQIKSEKDSLESTELSAKQDLNYSETVTSSDVNPNKESSARKRKLHIKSDELSNPSDENYHSEPELSREPEQWKRHEAKQPKRESNGENIPENNNVQDVTFIKQEVDVELSKQAPNVSDSITSLVGSRLMPADDQERDALWEQALAFNNGKMFTSQDGSQLTVNDSQASELQHGDMDQQMWLNVGQQVRLLCRFCNKCFYNVSNLQKHENWHNGKYTSYCKVCGKGFMSVSALRGHMAVHTGVKEFRCNVCGKDYAYKHVLKHHMKRIHASGVHVIMESMTQLTH